MDKSFLKHCLTIAVCLLVFVGCARMREKFQTTGQPDSAGIEVKSLFVNTGSLHLRACPAMNCQILSNLKRGEEIIKISEDREWTKVRVKNSKNEGWVASRYLSSTSPKPITAPPPANDSTKPQEEWASPGKGAKSPPTSAPKEDFAK